MALKIWLGFLLLAAAGASAQKSDAPPAARKTALIERVDPAEAAAQETLPVGPGASQGEVSGAEESAESEDDRTYSPEEMEPAAEDEAAPAAKTSPRAVKKAPAQAAPGDNRAAAKPAPSPEAPRVPGASKAAPAPIPVVPLTPATPNNP